MKVRIDYTVEVTDDYRRAINAYYGKPGIATRDEVKTWHQSYGDSMDSDIMSQLGYKEAQEDNS